MFLALFFDDWDSELKSGFRGTCFIEALGSIAQVSGSLFCKRADDRYSDCVGHIQTLLIILWPFTNVKPIPTSYTIWPDLADLCYGLVFFGGHFWRIISCYLFVTLQLFLYSRVSGTDGLVLYPLLL